MIELSSGNRTCPDVASTQKLAEEIGAQLSAGDVVILVGPLGAGKTTFTQGLARGLKVQGRVTSPTFQIAREHQPINDGPTLIHVDAYRLLEAGEDPIDALESLDLITELDHAVVVAEWGGGMMEQLAQRFIEITIDRTTAAEQDPESEARIISWETKEV
ncbi:tRNA (adenosine(37)-N6)-threonylcarbamoyltransferase complex ATPase subunit type 1 TsaE [Corynebacterium pelargi]|uniref:tRNA threonylcarbamoyladenosine biosynthesis protein TsaE n=1 Tax=Corynebacterium pelargi TaxID=1471400 RepID=A0A410WAT6_9CORY|nr:tRNA (adenosine(37)-N6)-threonylcarbamoyltransferase complex ATPase subunit type 1 TsaE [Corynebacterium pelargi]QAU53044.1 tRNA threonylcarbamoyladenosine biosynthesis protein TsaE [Corynebacterium pelargi]GGG75235.1 tRNA (adenosine(37)-N6)-threonylcarbamoyltransferase complex ATPase subunit type 1 TsaE [Corynebacterium pelargi]